LVGADVWSELLIDTASSPLFFCNTSLAELPEQESLKTEYVQCVGYGGYESCPDSDDVYLTTGVISGSVYKGDVFFENSLMSDVYYGIIARQDACVSAAILDGIFGVAYSVLNDAYILPADGTLTLSDIDVEVCEIDGDSKRVCNVTPSEDLVSEDLDSPIEASLQLNVESGDDHAEAFGLYVDYEATKGAAWNQVTPGLGALFTGDMAFNNSYYNGGTPQVSCIMVPYYVVHGSSQHLTNLFLTQVAKYTTPSGEDRVWYSLNLKSIRIPVLDNATFTYREDFCDDGSDTPGSNCITDSGNSRFELPIPEEMCNTAFTDDELESDLIVDIEGSDGNIVTLSFPLAFLVEEFLRGWFACTGVNGSFVLGMPVYQHYYLVYDMGNEEVVFVDLPQVINFTEEVLEDNVTAVDTGVASNDASKGTQDNGISNAAPRRIRWLFVAFTVLCFF
jgi:hypothetical protein